MHVSLKQISFSYDENKKETKNVKKVPVGICSEKFFKTDYEKKFYNQYKGNDLLCCEDNDIFT